MTKTVRDVMTADPISLPTSATLMLAATAMREADVGTIVVVERQQVVGIVTDRDIVVRAVADGRSPGDTTLGQICSFDLVVARLSDSLISATDLMRRHSLRRLPVVNDAGAPIGILSVGDLAVVLDPDSPLAEISDAIPNT